MEIIVLDSEQKDHLRKSWKVIYSEIGQSLVYISPPNQPMKTGNGKFSYMEPITIARGEVRWWCGVGGPGGGRQHCPGCVMS